MTELYRPRGLRARCTLRVRRTLLRILVAKLQLEREDLQHIAQGKNAAELAIGRDEQPAIAAALHPHQRIERIGRRRHDAFRELSPNFGDGLRVQAAAVWDCEDAGLAATSIPSVNLTP